MRVLLSTYGSRGDVEPVAGLAVALQTLGAEAIVSAPPDQEFTDLLARAGVKLVPAFMAVRQWIAEARQTPKDLPQLTAIMIAAQHEAINAAAANCDAIVATGLFPSVAAARCVAELRGLPFYFAAFCPMLLPSHHHGPFQYPGLPLSPDATDNRALWHLNRQGKNAVFGTAINAHRTAIGLPSLDNVRDHVFTPRPLLASDATLWPWQPTDLCDAVQTGAWFLPDNRPLPADLVAFLDAGSPPVYVGFGSIALPSVTDAARATIAALRARKLRMIVSRGWADLGLLDDDADSFAAGDVNHQALFPRVAAVVHHGGAGTTVTAAKAGTPQVIVPQIVDQPYWARQIADLGIGAAHDGPSPTIQTLSDSLDAAMDPAIRTRAAHVARTIRNDGARVAAMLLRDAIT